MFRTVTRPSSTKLQHLFRHARYSSTQEQELKYGLRVLLREVAQPVAVVTSFMRDSNPEPTNHAFHGATLSSFTSIAMDPYPLITFALRIPSRMATSLNAAASISLQDSSTPSSHMVVNLLSAQQASIAVKFSRPDLYPQPFDTVAYKLSEEGIPVLDGSLGALSCKLVSRAIPLHDLDFLRNGDTVPVSLREEDIVSELFVARVLRIERVFERTLPLVYHRRGYTTCREQ